MLMFFEIEITSHLGVSPFGLLIHARMMDLLASQTFLGFAGVLCVFLSIFSYFLLYALDASLELILLY